MLDPRSWFEEIDFGDLEAITCDELNEYAVGRREADLMLRVNAVVEAFEEDFGDFGVLYENLQDDEEGAPYDALEDLVFSIKDKIPDSDAMQWACGESAGWSGSLGEVVAAAVLGRSGRFQAVANSLDLMSNGQFFKQGQGIALVEGYQVLGSVASYAAAGEGYQIESLKNGPGWLFAGDELSLEQGISANPLCWIANSATSSSQRRLAERKSRFSFDLLNEEVIVLAKLLRQELADLLDSDVLPKAEDFWREFVTLMA